jgi:hypothetical protein
VAWRKGLRKVWKLPYDCSSSHVAIVSNTVPIYDELCRRVMNFIYSCIHCDSNLVQSIVLNGISAGMSSPIGRNVAHCSAHFNLGIGSIGVSKFRSLECLDFCYNRIDTESVVRANILREVLMIRDGLLEFSNDLFEVSDLDDFVNLLVR